MTVEADVVVAGAGHNSLITAAYLAMSARSVVMVDARPIPGGGAASEELLLPGYLIDTCSTGPSATSRCFVQSLSQRKSAKTVIY